MVVTQADRGCYFSVFFDFEADLASGFGTVASALANPGTCSAPVGTVIFAPLKSLPTGSNRPPNCSARKASVTALNDLLFSGRWKPCPSSGYSTYVTGIFLSVIALTI